jgi:hypothetical protein
MRVFSYVFHGLLALFVLVVSSLSMGSGAHTLQLDFLPWHGPGLTYWLFFSALIGLAFLFLALKGVLRSLFFLWSLAVFVILVKGFFLSPYFFEPGEFRTAVWLTLGAFLAVFGAWFRLRQQRDHWSKT